MDEINVLDKKAIHILLKYGTSTNSNISIDEFEYARKKGIMYNRFTYTHDEFMELIIIEYKKLKKHKTTILFVNSLFDNYLIKRAGLGVDAIMKTFINHRFEHNEDALPIATTPCKICSSWFSMNTDPNIQIQSIYKSGGISNTLLSDIYISLKLINLLKEETIKDEAINVFKHLFNIILNAEHTETPKSLGKKISKAKLFKSNEWQIQCILETLGYCGILHSEKYKGPFYEYVNLGVASRKRHSSDWSYPIDWWTGSDGIDKNAFEYWFGWVKELKGFYI